MNYRTIPIILLLTLILTSVNGKAQNFLFLEEKGPKALNAFISKKDNKGPIDWANEFGPEELVYGEKITLTGTFLIYRNRSLRYMFQIPSGTSPQWISAVIERVVTDPDLSQAYASGQIRIFDLIFTQEEISVELLMGYFEALFQEKESRENAATEFEIENTSIFEATINSYERITNHQGINSLYEQAIQQQGKLMNAALVGDPEGQLLYQNLRERYGIHIPAGDMPMDLSEAVRVLSGENVFGYPIEGRDIETSEASDSQNGQPGTPRTGNSQIGTQSGESVQGLGEGQGKPSSGDARPSNGSTDRGGSSSGLKGPLKIKTPFSKWFAVAMKVIVKYLGLEEIANKLLFIAYAIAPELFDYCASFLAKVQRAVTSGSFDNFMDQIADIYLHVEKFFDYALRIKDLLQDQSLKELADRIDWKKLNLDEALNEMQTLGVLSASKLAQIQQVIPTHLINGALIGDPRALQEHVIQYAKGKAVTAIDQQLKISGLPISVKDLADCTKSPDQATCVQDWTKHAVVDATTTFIPALGRYNDAAHLLMDGKRKEAVEKVVLSEISQSIGLDQNLLEPMYQALARGNYEEFLILGIDAGLDKAGRCRELWRTVEDQIDGQSVNTEDVLLDMTTCMLESMHKQAEAATIRTVAKDIPTSIKALEGWRNDIQNFGKLNDWDVNLSDGWMEEMEQMLFSLGWDHEKIKDYLQAEGPKAMQAYLEEVVKEMGFTAPGAAEALARGDFDQAITLQMTEGITPLSLQQKINIIRQRTLMATGMNAYLVHYMKSHLGDPSQVEKRIIQKLLNQ